MYMDLLHFTPITAASREEITAYTLASQSRICDLAFANLFGWAVKYETSYAIADDTLFIRFTSPARPHPAYLIPIRRGGAVARMRWIGYVTRPMQVVIRSS